MERGELARMGDSPGPGAIIELVDRGKGTWAAFLKLGTHERETVFQATG